MDRGPSGTTAHESDPRGSDRAGDGVCLLEDSNPFDKNVPFNLMMRSFDDIAVVARPSWMTVRNLARVISGMVVIILGVTAWGWTLRRKVRKQTAVLAARAAEEAEAERQHARLQQQRSRISKTSTERAPWRRCWRRSRNWFPSS